MKHSSLLALSVVVTLLLAGCDSGFITTFDPLGAYAGGAFRDPGGAE